MTFTELHNLYLNQMDIKQIKEQAAQSIAEIEAKIKELKKQLAKLKKVNKALEE